MIFVNNILNFFNLENLWEIRWAHGVNSKKVLEKVCSSDVMMIEGDIQSDLSENIIMAHPPKKISDITFFEWIDQIISYKKGAKIDFKDNRSVLPTLEYLKMKKPKIPIFLHADILKGAGGSESVFNPNEFIDLCNELYPEAVLSLGWTTGPKKNGFFSKDQVIEMLFYANKSKASHVTISVRASFLINSWNNIKEIYKFDRFSITLWNVEKITDKLKNFIIDNMKIEKTLLDLKNDEMFHTN